MGIRALQIGDAAQKSGGSSGRDEQRGNGIARLLEAQRHLEGEQCSHAVAEESHLTRRRLLGFEHHAEAIGHFRNAGVLREILAGTFAGVLHRNAFRTTGECPGEWQVELCRTAGVREDVQLGLDRVDRIGGHQIGISPCLRTTRWICLSRSNFIVLRSINRVWCGSITASMKPRSAAM